MEDLATFINAGLVALVFVRPAEQVLELFVALLRGHR
jgi:hypothetical protein